MLFVLEKLAALLKRNTYFQLFLIYFRFWLFSYSILKKNQKFADKFKTKYSSFSTKHIKKNSYTHKMLINMMLTQYQYTQCWESPNKNNCNGCGHLYSLHWIKQSVVFSGPRSLISSCHVAVRRSHVEISKIPTYDLG